MTDQPATATAATEIAAKVRSKADQIAGNVICDPNSPLYEWRLRNEREAAAWRRCADFIESGQSV